MILQLLERESLDTQETPSDKERPCARSLLARGETLIEERPKKTKRGRLNLSSNSLVWVFSCTNPVAKEGF